MKFKYYLRGLGTGILFATIILFISYSYRMSDNQIRKEAEKLGMVYAGEENKTTLNNNENQSGSSGEQASSNSVNDENSTPKETTSLEENTTPEETTTPEEPTTPEESTTPEETTTPEESTTPEEPTTPEEMTSQNADVVKCELIVSKDTSSYDVALALNAAGIIDNIDEFNNYLRGNGYATRIQNGKYTITSDMTFEEIAELICKKYW